MFWLKLIKNKEYDEMNIIIAVEFMIICIILTIIFYK
jgi:hypothetical protein